MYIDEKFNKQKNPSVNLRGFKNSVGKGYCIPSTFRREHQFYVTYFEPQTRLGIRLSLIRLDSALPPQEVCVL